MNSINDTEDSMSIKGYLTVDIDPERLHHPDTKMGSLYCLTRYAMQECGIRTDNLTMGDFNFYREAERNKDNKKQRIIYSFLPRIFSRQIYHHSQEYSKIILEACILPSLIQEYQDDQIKLFKNATLIRVPSSRVKRIYEQYFERNKIDNVNKIVIRKYPAKVSVPPSKEDRKAILERLILSKETNLSYSKLINGKIIYLPGNIYYRRGFADLAILKNFFIRYGIIPLFAPAKIDHGLGGAKLINELKTYGIVLPYGEYNTAITLADYALYLISDSAISLSGIDLIYNSVPVLCPYQDSLEDYGGITGTITQLLKIPFSNLIKRPYRERISIPTPIEYASQLKKDLFEE